LHSALLLLSIAQLFSQTHQVCKPAAVAFWIQIVSAALQLLFMVNATLLEPLLYASSISHDFHQNHRTTQHRHFYNNITPICHSKYNTQMAPTASTTARQHHRRLLLHSGSLTLVGVALFNGIFMVVANAVSKSFAALIGSGCPGSLSSFLSFFF
jgi:hypothetical protein